MVKSFANNPATPSAPGDGSATAYLEAPANTEVNIRLDAVLTTGDPLIGTPAGNLTDYWIDLYVMGVSDGTAISSQIAETTGHGPSIFPNSGGNACGALVYVNGQATQTALGWSVNTVLSSGTQFASLGGGATGIVLADWGTWHRLTVHFKYGAGLGESYGNVTQGFVEVFLDGTLVSHNRGNSSSTGLTSMLATANGQASWFPAVPGVKWRVCGPMATHDGTNSISLAPNWTATSSDPVSRIYMPYATRGTATLGEHWVVSANNSGVCVPTDYGSSAYRFRFVNSGTNTPGSGVVTTTTDELGSPSYNEHGWMHVVLSDLYCPANNSLIFQVYKSGGTSNLFEFFFSAGSPGGVAFAYDTGTLYRISYYTTTSRYALMLHLHRDGRARYTLLEITTGNTAICTTQVAFSGCLPNWTPQPLGKVAVTSAVTSGNALATEHGYVALAKRPTIAIVDSMSSNVWTPSGGATSILLRNANNVTRGFPFGVDQHSISNAYYPLKELGASRRVIVACAGTNGVRRHDWQMTAGVGLNWTSGVEYLVADGGLINDIVDIGYSSTDYATGLPVFTGNVNAFFAQCAANDCQVFCATSLTRTYDNNTQTTVSGDGSNSSSAYSANQRAAIGAYNTALKNSLVQYQAKGLFFLADIDADKTANPANYPDTTAFWSDQTHPVAPTFAAPYLGCGYIAKQMLALRTPVAGLSPPRKPHVIRVN